jgi:hypothetical protein
VTAVEKVEYITRKGLARKIAWARVAQAIFRAKPFHVLYPTFSTAFIRYTYSPMKTEQTESSETLVFKHNIHNIQSTASQFSISQKALGTFPDDGNVMPKHVGATIHNQ